MQFQVPGKNQGKEGKKEKVRNVLGIMKRQIPDTGIGNKWRKKNGELVKTQEGESYFMCCLEEMDYAFLPVTFVAFY